MVKYVVEYLPVPSDESDEWVLLVDKRFDHLSQAEAVMNDEIADDRDWDGDNVNWEYRIVTIADDEVYPKIKNLAPIDPVEIVGRLEYSITERELALDVLLKRREAAKSEGGDRTFLEDYSTAISETQKELALLRRILNG